MGITCINHSRNWHKTSIGFYKFYDKIRKLLKVPVQQKSTVVRTIR